MAATTSDTAINKPQFPIQDTLHEIFDGKGALGVELGRRLAEATLDRKADDEARETRKADGGGLLAAYASETGRCPRQIGFRLAGYEGTPFEFEAVKAMWEGRVMEEAVVMALDTLYEGEAQARFQTGSVRGRLDYRYDEPESLGRGGKVVVEIKTVHSWPFGQAFKANAPKKEHVAQASLGAHASAARAVHLIYVARGNGARGAPGVLEWVLPALPLDDLVDPLNETVLDIEQGILPARSFEGSVIDDPSSTRWPCGYCRYRSACTPLPSRSVSLDSLPKETA
jgi:hypothetical protein